MSILENLYNGNINPSDIEGLKNNTKYKKILNLVNKAKVKLIDTMTDEQMILFENYIINADELSIVIDEEVFKSAFSLALKIMMEIIQNVSVVVSRNIL
jgi:hypothetical protein